MNILIYVFLAIIRISLSQCIIFHYAFIYSIHIHIECYDPKTKKFFFKVCHLKATEMSSSLGGKDELNQKKKKEFDKILQAR